MMDKDIISSIGFITADEEALTSEDELIETVVSRTKMFSGNVFSAELMEVKLANGEPGMREIVRHNGGATIVPLDHDNNVYMVRQFRAPFQKVLLETPAGKLEPGEDPRECAIRELLEETGLRAESVVELGSIYASPGYCSEVLHMYLATGLTEGQANLDEGEFLNVVKIPISKLLESIESGSICDAKSVVALLKTARRLKI
jgi:ADP-ribose pyrophosphatase